ncbi:MAG: hypothetical protein AAF362_17595 [Pseudomonadota bacterium]
MARLVGILALARPTFDVAFANETLAAMLDVLDKAGLELVGPRELLMDTEAAQSALAGLIERKVDTILVLQVTFTDAAMICEVGEAFPGHLAIWSVPEPRIGGRLRLNSFCGLNLASHALGLRDRAFSYVYGSPQDEDILARICAVVEPESRVEPIAPETGAASVDEEAQSIASSLAGARIGRIGEHPVGFDTCAYDRDALSALAGIEIDEIELDELFTAAHDLEPDQVVDTKALAEKQLCGLEDVDQKQLDRSLRLKVALDELRKSGGHDAFAIRCWPETFTEYGGAVCGPVSMMGEKRIPCACEADVYGALTQLLLQRTANAPVFLADVVDMDIDDDTGVIWHCGQAPISMAACDTKPSATIHTNRKMPLLYEFPLKPGRVTFMRISQARGNTFMVIGSGEILERDMAFTGTSGVVRFDKGTKSVLADMIGAGLEHHVALAYGDHSENLRRVAAALDLPVLEL